MRLLGLSRYFATVYQLPMPLGSSSALYWKVYGSLDRGKSDISSGTSTPEDEEASPEDVKISGEDRGRA